MSKKRIIIQKKDIKSTCWSDAAKELNLGELIPVAGSPMYMPFVLLKYTFTGRLPNAIMFRYLNDYKSLLRTVLRTLTDLTTILIARITGVSVFWICHNVNKESESYHPQLTKLRRKTLKNNSKKIFVLDQLLIEPAIRMLNIGKNNIAVTNFGKVDTFNSSQNKHDSDNAEQTIARIQNWDLYKNRASNNSLTGLWIGSPSGKLLFGLKILAQILEKQKNSKPRLAFVVIGPIGEWLKKVDYNTYVTICNDNACFLIDKQVEIPPHKWSDLCDFIWKPSSDWSVNLTIYNSAVAKLPVIGFTETFFGQFITHYGLGIAINPKPFIAENLIEKIKNWSPNKASLFIEQNTWQKGAKKIFDAL